MSSDAGRIDAGAGRGKAAKTVLKLLVGGLILFRLLFGAMWTFSGVNQWILGDDPVGHLLEAVERSVAEERSSGVYRTLLDRVVAPNAPLFTALVAIGELGTGVALLGGYPARAGALGAVFMLSNYEAAFGGPGRMPGGNGMLALMHLPLLLGAPYRRLTVRRWMPRWSGGGEQTADEPS